MLSCNQWIICHNCLLGLIQHLTGLLFRSYPLTHFMEWKVQASQTTGVLTPFAVFPGSRSWISEVRFRMRVPRGGKRLQIQFFPQSSVICPGYPLLALHFYSIPSFSALCPGGLTWDQVNRILYPLDPMSSGFPLGLSKGDGLVGGDWGGHICFPSFLWPDCHESCIPLPKVVAPMRQSCTCGHTLARFWKLPSARSPSAKAPFCH